MLYILVGQVKVNHDLWKSEGWTHKMLMGKLKEHARSKKLGREANQGKQAVDLKKAEGEPIAEEWGAQDESGDINALANVKCYLCKKRALFLPMPEGT